MRLWLNTSLRCFAASYFVVTSLYCLLAFLPYTYYFLIKAPAYAWMPWFVHHQSGLFWLAGLAALAANFNFADSWRHKNKTFLISIAVFFLVGTCLIFRPFLESLQNTRAAYWWSLAALVAFALASVWHPTDSSVNDDSPKSSARKLLPYSSVLLCAFVLSATYDLSARTRIYSQTRTLAFHLADAEFVIWSLISHVVLAVGIFSVINLVAVLAAKTSKPRVIQIGFNGGLIFLALWAALFRFLDSALSFSGWSAQLYAAALSLTITLWGSSVVLPFLQARRDAAHLPAKKRFQFGVWTALLGACTAAIGFPYFIGEADWSGFLQSIVTLLIWVVVGVAVFHLRPKRAEYSALVLVATLVSCALAYKCLQATAIFWSRPLGSTDDEISLALEGYTGHDNSFQLAHHILGNSRNEVCGDLCRILRENTNIRDNRATHDVQLVERLSLTASDRPNIFVFVIDSMRPDYLGAYNPKVDYTPNLDAFARDSVVLHNVYSQYAGTSLSEPAIWSGAMMLHAHYPQPFSRLNSLDRMLHTDGYRMIVSADEVLSAILPSDDDLTKLDTDKKLWNQLELGSTLHQAEAVLDSRRQPDQPVFVYAQPKNVHQFARNDVPSPASQHWLDRPGLNTRITYEVHWVDSCFGQFFNYLKQHGLYDNSIIVVTSDHGDATGEFGRMSHSTSIWPEVMRVPLMIHLPQKMRNSLVYDDGRIAALTDLTPTLYYLLGHHPIEKNPLYGRPLFAKTAQELSAYPLHDLLLASDVRAVYGILTADGRYLYTTYDSPPQSYLFDLAGDPNAQHDILTPALKRHYDEEIIENLQTIGDYYGYKPGVGRLLASANRRD